MRRKRQKLNSDTPIDLGRIFFRRQFLQLKSNTFLFVFIADAAHDGGDKIFFVLFFHIDSSFWGERRKWPLYIGGIDLVESSQTVRTR
jgi:hypothetical protein